MHVPAHMLTEPVTQLGLTHTPNTRAFRATRGQSIGGHVAQCRIDHAKRLLSADSSIKAVAYTLGFASPSSFSFAFRRATGQTPREFQARSAAGGRAQ